MIKYVIILLCLPFICLGQTTEDEFNYVTKGYNSQIESGLDPVKKNYRIEDIPIEYTSTSGTFTFKKFIKYPDSLKCIMMIMKLGNTNNYHACIPHPKTDNYVWIKCMKQMNAVLSSTQQYADVGSAMIRVMNYFAYPSKASTK